MDSGFKQWWLFIPHYRSYTSGFLVQKPQGVQEHSSYKDKISGFSMNLILYRPSFHLLSLRKLHKKLILPFHICNWKTYRFSKCWKPNCLKRRHVAHVWANIRTYVWVGEGSHATIGIATSSTVTSLYIPLACVKTIF